MFRVKHTKQDVIRVRVLLGMFSALHGLLALLSADSGLRLLMQKGTWEDFTWPCALLIFGWNMSQASFCKLYKTCDTFLYRWSAFLLGCTWITILLQSLEERHIGQITIQSVPVIILCLWVWVHDVREIYKYNRSLKGT